MVSEGEVEQGMRCLDEASAAAMGGEYEEDLPICWTCCYLIYACEHVRDFDRAAQWSRKVEEFAERRRIQFVHGVCRAHYACGVPKLRSHSWINLVCRQNRGFDTPQVERMRRQNLTNRPVTTSDGRFVGLLMRTDAEQALGRLDL